MENFDPHELDASERYRDLKAEILQYERQKVKLFNLQNRVSEIELEMEIPNKRFFSKCLEKKKSAYLTTLKSEDALLVTEPNEILNIVHKFYSKLWGDNVSISEKEQDDYLNTVTTDTTSY